MVALKKAQERERRALEEMIENNRKRFESLQEVPLQQQQQQQEEEAAADVDDDWELWRDLRMERMETVATLFEELEQSDVSMYDALSEDPEERKQARIDRNSSISRSERRAILAQANMSEREWARERSFYRSYASRSTSGTRERASADDCLNAVRKMRVPSSSDDDGANWRERVANCARMLANELMHEEVERMTRVFLVTAGAHAPPREIIWLVDGAGLKGPRGTRAMSYAEELLIPHLLSSNDMALVVGTLSPIASARMQHENDNQHTRWTEIATHCARLLMQAIQPTGMVVFGADVLRVLTGTSSSSSVREAQLKVQSLYPGVRFAFTDRHPYGVCKNRNVEQINHWLEQAALATRPRERSALSMLHSQEGEQFHRALVRIAQPELSRHQQQEKTTKLKKGLSQIQRRTLMENGITQNEDTASAKRQRRELRNATFIDQYVQTKHISE